MSYVNLSGTRLGDDDLESLEGLPDIDVLDLSDTLVTDAGLIHLCQLTRLQLLVLDGTHITERGLSALRKALPGVAIVISRTAGTREFSRGCEVLGSTAVMEHGAAARSMIPQAAWNEAFSRSNGGWSRAAPGEPLG